MQTLTADKHFKVKGFTLIELAIVIAVIAAVTGMGMMVTMEAVEAARRASTNNRMDEIEKALVRFRNINNRLPCPTDPTLATSNANYAKEAVTSGACSTGISKNRTDGRAIIKGGVPTQSLGLPNEFMLDGWGRRFSYFVDPNLSKDNAFNIIPPDANNCVISIADASANARTDGAAYGLLSHGKNGHGAYLETGGRVNAAVSNAHERADCWCSAALADFSPARLMFYQKPPIESTSAISVFDDIVRYKERWQLQNEDDYKADEKFREYQLVVNYGNGIYKFYKRGCSGWKASSTASVTPDIAGNCQDSVFSADNNTLFTHCDSTSANCQPYSTKSRTIVASTCDPDQTACVPVCPEWFAYGMMSSGNDIIAIPTIASPWVQIYKASNTSTASPHLTPLSANQPVSVSDGMGGYKLPEAWSGTYPSNNYGQPTNSFPLGSVPSARPTIVEFSKDGTYMFLSDKDTYADMYMKEGDGTYRKMKNHSTSNLDYGSGIQSGQPLGSVCDAFDGTDCRDLYSAAFSPDGKYFAVTYNHSSEVNLLVWNIDTNGATPFIGTVGPFKDNTSIDVSDLNGDGQPGPANLAFSPDSQYLVVTIEGDTVGGGDDVDTSHNLWVYKIDPGDVFTSIRSGNFTGQYPADGHLMAGIKPMFTPDSQEFLVPFAYDDGHYDILSFQKRSPVSFSLFAYPTDNVGVLGSPFYGTDPISAMTIMH